MQPTSGDEGLVCRKKNFTRRFTTKLPRTTLKKKSRPRSLPRRPHLDLLGCEGAAAAVWRLRGASRAARRGTGTGEETKTHASPPAPHSNPFRVKSIFFFRRLECVFALEVSVKALQSAPRLLPKLPVPPLLAPPSGERRARPPHQLELPRPTDSPRRSPPPPPP